MNVSGHRLSTTEIESALVDASARRRGRRRWQSGRAHRRGDLRFVILKSGVEPHARAWRRAAPARGRQDRPDRAAETAHVHSGSAENTLRQDHAPAAARHRRRAPARGYDDPGRRRRRRDDPRSDPDGVGRVGEGGASLKGEKEEEDEVSSRPLDFSTRRLAVSLSHSEVLAEPLHDPAHAIHAPVRTPDPGEEM